MISKLGWRDEACKKWDWILLFEDAVHQLHTTNPWYAIQKRGKANTKILNTNTGRKRYTVLWAVNPHNGDFISAETDWMCNVDLAKELLDNIAEKYKEQMESWIRVRVVLDNARYQRATAVQEYAKEKGIILEFLPAYCPHLNLIERLRKRLKKKLKNQYVEKFEDFCIKVNYWLRKLPDCYNEVAGILNMKFYII